LEARGLYAQIVVPGVGVIHLDVGNVLITFDFETGEADVEGSGKWSDFPVDQVCALLSG